MKKLGVVGGMGPMATVNLYKKIVELTDASCDQDHLNILIYNNSSIPDRTSYILNDGNNPLPYLINSAKTLQEMGADYLIMPCNTAHYFYHEMIKHINIPFINMIEETAKYIKSNYPMNKSVGLLSTQGTYKAGVYNKVFDDYNIKIEIPSDENRMLIMDLIYSIKNGNSPVLLDGFYQAIKEIKSQRIDLFILGCTELSFVYDLYKLEGNFINPLEILAIEAIKYGGKNVKLKLI